MAALRVGIVTEGLREAIVDGRWQIGNGGVGVYTYHLVRELLRLAGDEEYFLIRRGRGHLDVYADPRARGVFLSSAPLTDFTLLLDIPLRRVARELSLDVIHFANQYGGAFLPRGISSILTLHDMTPFLFPGCHPWKTVVAYRIFMRSWARAATRILVPSAATKGDVINARLATGDRIDVVPLGVADVFRGSTSSPPNGGLAAGGRYLLTVGVLEPRKNHRLLLDVLRRLRITMPDLSLVVVGREGWGSAPRFDREIPADLRSHVRILRGISNRELARVYADATVFVYPSLYEGFGLPVAEAMSAGVPVVVSRTSSLPELVGDDGLLADPNDADEFAAQVSRLLADDGLRQRLGEAGKRRAERWTWRATAERTLAVYREVGENSSRTRA